MNHSLYLPVDIVKPRLKVTSNGEQVFLFPLYLLLSPYLNVPFLDQLACQANHLINEASGQFVGYSSPFLLL